MASNGNGSILPDFTNIVQKIWEVVQNDHLLETFDIIAPEKTPEGYLCPLKYEHHNLGLEGWYVKHMFLSVYHKLLEKKLTVENQKAFLTTALLLNCNVKTFWNMRRKFVLQNQLDILVELRFIKLVLSFWRKCADAIYYRKWLLRDKLAEKPVEFLVNELEQMQEIADHHAENNHVPWDYCIWLHDQCDSHPEFAAFTYSAWHLSGQYMCSHPSDASHMSYRQQIVRRIVHNRDRLKEVFLKLAKDTAVEEGLTGLSDDDTYLVGILIYEFNLNMGLMEFWRSHEGIWCYRRSLIWFWFVDLPDLVSRRGERRVQQLACSSNNDCPFRMYFFNHLQPKFYRSIKTDICYVKGYKDWINSFV